MFEMTPDQHLAITTQNQSVIVSAGAGSGKTAVLVQRYLTLLKSGLTPSQILAVTFTTEAAEELKHRILSHLEGKVDTIAAVERSPYIGTIHGFCYHVLSHYGSLLELPRLKRILTPFEIANAFNTFYQEWLESLSAESFHWFLDHFPIYELRDVVRTLYDKRFFVKEPITENNTEPENDTEVFRKVYELSLPLVKRLEVHFHHQGIFSFDDLESLTLKLLREFPVARNYYFNQLKALLIDEFQDTSRYQWEIIRLVIGEGGDNRKKLFVVGDPKQSIYSFRYAEVGLLLDLIKKSSDDGALSLNLSLNFRSQPPLLDDINQKSAVLFREGPIAFVPMQVGLTLQHPEAAFHVRSYATVPKAPRQQLQKVEMNEVVGVAEDLIRRGVAPQDIALLFRNGDRIGLYADALRAVNIPVFCEQTSMLFKIYDVLDIVNYLRAVVNPNDDLSLAAFLASPYGGKTYADLYGFFKDIPEPRPSFFEHLRSKGDFEGLNDMKWFFNLIEEGELLCSRVLARLFRHSRYFAEHAHALLAFCEPLSEPGLNVADVVRHLKAWQREEILIKSETGQKATGIRLMTVHAAKGLEFNHVVLADNLRQPPHRVSSLMVRPGYGSSLRYRKGEEWEEPESFKKLKEMQQTLEKEEAQRILYVALTRAKVTLTLVLPEDYSACPKGSWAQLLSMK